MNRLTYTAIALLTAGTLMACQQQQDGSDQATEAQTPASATAEQVSCDNCGEVESIQSVQVKGEPRAGAAVAGAILGGVIGHQFGSGSGNDAATAAGAVGGAVAGSEIDRKRNSQTLYQIVVQMDNGQQVKRTVPQRGGLNIGDAVRVQGDQIIPLS